MVIVTLAKVPSGMSLAGLLRLGIVHVEGHGGHPFGGGVDLGEERAEVGRLGDVEAAAAVLGRQAEGVAGAADEPAVLAALGVMPPAVAVAAEEAHA